MNRCTLVTGATGFIGCHLVESLLKRRPGGRVVCLVRDQTPDSRFSRDGLAEKVTVVTGDLREERLIARIMTEYGVTEIFHLAAQAIVGVALAQPAETLDVNVRGTWSLLEAARRHASPLEAIVVMSSDKAYGRLSGDLYSETMPLAGEAPYDASKSCADLIARSYAVSYGMPISVCRPGNAFGPGDYNISRIFPSTILAVLSGKRPQIRSDGSSVRDYVYAGDIADALVNVAEATRKSGLKGQAFNVAYGSVHSVMAVTKLILRMMDSDLEPEILSVATHEIPEQRLAHARIDALQSGKWKHGFEEGVRETIAWYRSAFVRGHIRPIG